MVWEGRSREASPYSYILHFQKLQWTNHVQRPLGTNGFRGITSLNCGFKVYLTKPRDNTSARSARFSARIRSTLRASSAC